MIPSLAFLSVSLAILTVPAACDTSVALVAASQGPTLLQLSSTVSSDATKRQLESEHTIDSEGRFDGNWMMFEIGSLTIIAFGSIMYRTSRSKGSRKSKPKTLSSRAGHSKVPAAYEKNCASEEQLAAMKIRQERRTTMVINSKNYLPDGPQQVCNVLDTMKRRGFSVNVIHYGAAIAVCAKKENAFNVALSLLEDMRQNNVKPDVVCYNAAITACARSNQCDLAFQLLREMADEGLQPQHVTVNAVLDACAKSGQDEKARRVLQSMPAMGLEAQVTTYGTVINACAKVGNYESALGLLDEMEKAGLECNVHCYSAAINACAKSARSKQAVDILRRMTQRGVTPNQIAWSTTINACLKGGSLDLALGLLDEMKMAGVQPDDITYHVMIRDLKKSNFISRDVIQQLQAERAEQSPSFNKGKMRKAQGDL